MIKILLADDHEIMRAGLKLFIQDLIAQSVIHEARDGISAYEKVTTENFELIILDVNMPETDSFGLVKKILNWQPEAKILIFSMNAEEIYAKRYLQLGVRGYVNKIASSAELGNAITSVLNNERYIGPALKQQLTEEALHLNPTYNPFEKLTRREFEIAQHLIIGQSLSAVCKSLNLHPSTVGTFKARILEKLNCKNIIEVNQLARAYNVIPQL